MSAAARTNPEELREAELFESDGRQAVRLPDGIHLDGTKVKIRRVSGGILLEMQPPKLDHRRTAEEIDAMFREMDSYGADPLFPDGRDQGVAEVRLPIR